MIPNSTQIKRFVLFVQLPLNSYVPLSALDGEDPTLIQSKPIVQQSPLPPQQPNPSLKKGMKNHEQQSQQQQQQSQPILTKEEELIVSQTRWLTTSHFKDFLSDVLNDIKNAQMTSTFSQFHDHRSNHHNNNNQKEKIQLVGSAALVVELEEKRRLKLAEQDALEKKLKRTAKGRHELAKQQQNKQHDPLSGLSAAFGYGLGVGRTGDIAQMSLPIIDQLIVSTQRK